MDPMVFQFIGASVSNATNAFLTPAAQQLMESLQAVALGGVTLYFLLTGYAVLSGAVTTPFWTVFRQCIKIALVAGIALNMEGYTAFVLDFIGGLETGLLQAMTGASTDATSTYALLDHSLGKGLAIAARCFQSADDAGMNIGAALSWMMAGLTVAAGTSLVTVLGGATIVVAKFTLAMLFALGPLFILCLMFPVTARFFDSWFSQTINYVLTIAIMATVMVFAMKAYDAFIADADFSGTGDANPLFAALQIGTLTGVLMWIILQVGSMASGLAGGVSLAALGIRHLVSPLTASTRLMGNVGNLANPMSTRRDLQSGMMVTARRANHLVAGNTVWNPAYRRHVLEHLGKNWGKATGGKIKPDK